MSAHSNYNIYKAIAAWEESELGKLAAIMRGRPSLFAAVVRQMQIAGGHVEAEKFYEYVAGNPGMFDVDSPL
jgi:hypothetical protein